MAVDRDDGAGEGEPLVGDGVTPGIVRIGDTVRRPVRPFTATIQAYLAHLRSVGFTGAPVPLGIDGQGREVLSYVPGDVPREPRRDMDRTGGPGHHGATCRGDHVGPSVEVDLTLGQAHMPAEPSMASRIRSACPLWRAYSSTRCCHIQRTEVVFSRNVNVSSSFAPSSAASTARHSAR
jgi:hypothetical protein